VDKLHRAVKGRGMRVVAVDVEEREALPQVAAFARQADLQLPIALQGGDVAERYRVTNLPHLVIVDRAGRVARVLLGVHGADELEKALEEADR
jgi:hypothetical protein